MKKFKRGLVLPILLILLCINSYASDKKLEDEILKPSIKKYYLENEKVTKMRFISCVKQEDGNYLVIVQYKATYGRFQDKVRITTSGKILSIVEDLNVMPIPSFSC